MYTIAWDVDDVLNDLMKSWFECCWLTSHQDCPFTYDELEENPPHSILGITRNEYLASLDVYRLSQAAGQMQPNHELITWFNERGGNFRHMALTATPLKTAYISAYWVVKHFGKWIRTFHFVPSVRENEAIPKYDGSKSDFLKWIDKIDILIDDNESNIEEAKKIGIMGILVSRPWNNNGYPIKEVINLLTDITAKGLTNLHSNK